MVVLHRSVRAQETGDRALVLLAMGIEHDIERGWFGWRLTVPEHEAERAREQIKLWEYENQRRRLPARVGKLQPGGSMVALCWSVTLMAFYTLQTRHAFGLDWVGLGKVDVGQIYAGEWWRAATALTLHADIGHIVANIGFGAVFGALLGREIGGGLAACLIVSGGIAGNLMNALVQPMWHTSAGASTAVFAALGALAAWLWLGRRLDQTTWARRATPLVGGLILLGWLGTGNERTDIVAHLTGFIAGFVSGAIIGRRVTEIRTTVGRESALGAVAGGSVLLAWCAAIWLPS